MRNIKYFIQIMVLFSVISFVEIINAQTLKTFDEIIKLDEHGNATVAINFETEKYSINEIILPWNFNSEIKDINTENKIKAKLIKVQGNKFLRVYSSDSTMFSSGKINVSLIDYFDLKKEEIKDFGDYIFKYRFMNTKIMVIKDFSIKIILPEGFNITSVDETIPKATQEEAISPFEINREEGRNFVILKVENVKLGENAFIKLRFKQEEKSIILLILLSIVGILYLLYFVDIVKPKKEKE